MTAPRLGRVVLAALLALGSLAGAGAGPAPQVVRAATPDLTIVSAARVGSCHTAKGSTTSCAERASHARSGLDVGVSPILSTRSG